MIESIRNRQCSQVTNTAGVDGINGSLGITGNFDCDLYQVGICGLSLLFSLGVEYGKHTACGDTCVIMESGNSITTVAGAP